jgi:hypothetical protein
MAKIYKADKYRCGDEEHQELTFSWEYKMAHSL